MPPKITPEAAERIQMYYIGAVGKHRLRAGFLWLFGVFVVIAAGSKDGTNAMMQTLGSLFDAPGVSRVDQFYKLMPVVFLLYSIWTVVQYRRRLGLRDAWLGWLGRCRDDAPRWQAARIDLAHDLASHYAQPNQSLLPESWHIHARFGTRALNAAVPVVCYLFLRWAAFGQPHLDEYGTVLRQAISLRDHGILHWAVLLVYAFLAGQALVRDWQSLGKARTLLPPAGIDESPAA